MTTSIMTMLFLALATLFALISAAPVALDKRAVFVPPVLYPHAGTIWKIGSTHNVTWDVSNPPASITNNIGKVVLSQGGRLLDLNDPLASGFNILDGRVEVQVPDVTPGNDYSIVVFGDSGNNGQQFTITN